MEKDTDVNADNSGFRLSRISHPRASLWAMILLLVVFLGFGLAAQAYVPAIEPVAFEFTGLTAMGSDSTID